MIICAITSLLFTFVLSRGGVPFFYLNKIYYMLYNKPNYKYFNQKSFWVLVWFSIVAKFGRVILIKGEGDGDNCCCFSIGTSTPIDEFWNNGYKVYLVGKIFGEHILCYEI